MICKGHETRIISILLLDEEISITEFFFSFPQSAQARPKLLCPPNTSSSNTNVTLTYSTSYASNQNVERCKGQKK